MKMNEDPRLLAHMRAVQAERKAQAMLKARARQDAARLAMARVATASKAAQS